jgi:glycogen debranching enzyme
VQGYVYAARQAGARMAAQLGQVELARRLSAQAIAIQEQFEETFWDEELNTYVIALDGRKKPCRVLSSNAGHCLFTGISRPERAARLLKTLMGEQLACGWGIRTLGSREVRYNPMSYHNGSVWPHDNAIIARGLARYGYKREASQILTALFDVSMFMPRNRLPELFCGFHRRTAAEGPTLYPVACSPQAWSSGAAYLLLQACFGIEVNSGQGSVSFSSPHLPEILSEIRFSNLRLGASSVDVALHREKNNIRIEVLRNEGGVDIQLDNAHE